jgi:hypothetical protein
VPFVKKTVQEELEADDIAMQIVLADYQNVLKFPDRLRGMSIGEREDIEMTLAGVVLFFAIDDLMVKVSVGLSGDYNLLFPKDHPPSVYRGARLLHNISERLGKGVVSTASILFNWVEHQMDGVVKHIRQSGG